MTLERRGTLADWVASLPRPAILYARAYSEHLSVGDPLPAVPGNVDDETAQEIRRRFDAEWRRRVWGSR